MQEIFMERVGLELCPEKVNKIQGFRRKRLSGVKVGGQV